MAGLFDGVEKTGSRKDKYNRRSLRHAQGRLFGCGTHDGAVSAFAQDDSLLEEPETLVDVELLWVDPQHDVSAVEMLLHLAHLDVDVVAYCDGRFHHAGSGADIAGGGQGALERLLDALASDGHKTKVVELKNLRWGSIVL